jgi:hypothetical protein
MVDRRDTKGRTSPCAVVRQMFRLLADMSGGHMHSNATYVQRT